MKILLMGPQGCGKGTQGELLSSKLGIPLVSVGQLLRDLSPTSPWYAEVKSDLNSGRLVSNTIAAAILCEEIKKDEYKNGFIFDGWGRRMKDLNTFDPNFDKVLYIHISEQTTIARLSTRRTCSSCGKIYNIVSMPSKVEGICDACGGTLIQREDDKEEAIQKRLEIFNTETQEVLHKFSAEDKLIEINGEQTPDAVFAEITAKLGI
jgi:adenylate kinase